MKKGTVHSAYQNRSLSKIEMTGRKLISIIFNFSVKLSNSTIYTYNGPEEKKTVKKRPPKSIGQCKPRKPGRKFEDNIRRNLLKGLI